MKAQVTVKQFVVWDNGENEFYSREDAEKFAAEKAEELISEGFESFIGRLEIKERVCGFVTESGYSDAYPYEIVRVVSDKCLEIRALSAELINGEELKFHVGGFSAHCSNQRAQEYSYSRNEKAGKIKIRLNKYGKWALKGRRFHLTEAPYKFEDFNF